MGLVDMASSQEAITVSTEMYEEKSLRQFVAIGSRFGITCGKYLNKTD